MNIIDQLAVFMLEGKAKNTDNFESQIIMEIPMPNGSDVVFTIAIYDNNKSQYCAYKKDVVDKDGDLVFSKLMQNENCFPNSDAFLRKVFWRMVISDQEARAQKQHQNILEQLNQGDRPSSLTDM